MNDHTLCVFARDMTHNLIPFRYGADSFEKHISIHKVKGEGNFYCVICQKEIFSSDGTVRISEIINHFSEHTLDDENKQKCPNPIVTDCQVEKGYKDEIIHRIRFHCMEMSEIKHIIQSLLTEEIKEDKVYRKLTECKQETNK